MFKVGVFHTHNRHPAIFSRIDIDMHPYKNLWHMILCLRNLEQPQARAFSINDGKAIEIPISIIHR